MNTIFFHEDFYKLIEFLPKENYFEISHYNKNNSNFSKQNTFGFIEMDIIPPPTFKLIDRKIPIAALEKILNQHSIFFSDNINSGYGNTSYDMDNIIGYGYEYFTIFVSYESEIVSDIWIWDSKINEGTGENFVKTISLIIDTFDLLLIDWRKLLIIYSDSYDIIKKYLNIFTWASIK
ncbi:MAG: hypothetical protein WCY16_02970 [Weeksellaceae bacterium]